MKASPSPLAFCVALLFIPLVSAPADTVKLKSGDTVIGTIISDTDKEVVMDVLISAGITDQKNFAKADVESVSKTAADTGAYEGIKDYRVGSHSLQLAAYPAMVKPLEAFLKDYPQSSHAAAVKEALAAFKQEEARVKAGELKWDNRWYSVEDVEKHKYQLAAGMAFETMKDLAARRDYIGALNAFAQIETNYPGSAVYPDAVEMAQTAMRQLIPEMERQLAAAKVQESQFNSGIVLVPEPQKSQMIAAWKAKVDASEAAFAAATKSNAKWKPFLPLAPKSFEANKATIVAEFPRLSKLPLADMRASLASAKEAEAAIQAQKTALASTKLKEAEKSWAQNERVKELGADLQALKDTLKAKAAPTPAASPSASPAKHKFF